FAGCAAGGCAASSKGEATRLLRAVDHFRHVPDAAKTDEARAIASLACTDPKVCEAKRVCVAALEPTARALFLKEDVASRVRDIEQARLAPNAPEAQRLPAELDEAERLLRDGRDRMPECERKLTDLSVDYGV
ncbi:MAG: hypothetical protein M3O50_08375, partial [Myxococcota bacterium]|nr:hypothetical protein [Myxococcota bacterium]